MRPKADFREFGKGELRRTPLLGSSLSSNAARRPFQICYEALGRIERPDRGPFRPFGGQGTGKALLCGLARQGRAPVVGWQLAEAIGEADPQGVSAD
jgi:hypothetical protein